MKKVKYIGGLGDEATIVFKGSRQYRFNKDQVLVVDDEAAAQLLETENFVDAEDAVKKIKGDK